MVLKVIDFKAEGKSEVTKQTDDKYLKLLIKIYRYVLRRIESELNADILERLIMIMSKDNQRPTISLKRVINVLKDKDGKIGVVVGVVTDDDSIGYHVPTIKLATLYFTDTARARIESAGGECLPFEQLPSEDILGHNTVLVKE